MKRSATTGFTLVELLIVIVIMCILAVIAIPKFMSTKSNAYIVTMKSDLRNLATADAAYFSDSSTYVVYGDTTKLKMRPSAGVSAPVVTVGPSYWSATVTHSQVPTIRCGISVSTVNTVVATAGDGEPACQ